MSDSYVSDTHESAIVASWRKNVAPWVKAIANDEIESRRLTTNRAVVEAVTSLPGPRVLDIGCGEGWLVRELSAHGKQLTGVDAVPELIDAARRQGGGDFQVISYEQLSGQISGQGSEKSFAEKSFAEKFDTAVCNFSLLGKESVELVVKAAPAILRAGGHLVVQTLHPLASCGPQPYVDGWREGSWDGFSGEFCDPAPWYFRTLESWVQLFLDSGLQLVALREPLHAQSRQPASLLLIGRC